MTTTDPTDLTPRLNTILTTYGLTPGALTGWVSLDGDTTVEYDPDRRRLTVAHRLDDPLQQWETSVVHPKDLDDAVNLLAALSVLPVERSEMYAAGFQMGHEAGKAEGWGEGQDAALDRAARRALAEQSVARIASPNAGIFPAA